MKTHTTLITILLVTLLFSVTKMNAQEYNFSDREISNLVAGIESENNGLMRSSVYFAGFYKVKDAVASLVKKLETEDDPSNVILIAMAIYKIGDKEAMMKVLDTANNSYNPKIKRMLTAITLEYLNETNSRYVFR